MCLRDGKMVKILGNEFSSSSNWSFARSGINPGHVFHSFYTIFYCRLSTVTQRQQQRRLRNQNSWIWWQSMFIIWFLPLMGQGKNFPTGLNLKEVKVLWQKWFLASLYILNQSQQSPNYQPLSAPPAPHSWLKTFLMINRKWFFGGLTPER